MVYLALVSPLTIWGCSFFGSNCPHALQICCDSNCRKERESSDFINDNYVLNSFEKFCYFALFATSGVVAQNTASSRYRSRASTWLQKHKFWSWDLCRYPSWKIGERCNTLRVTKHFFGWFILNFPCLYFVCCCDVFQVSSKNSIKLRKGFVFCFWSSADEK